MKQFLLHLLCSSSILLDCLRTSFPVDYLTQGSNPETRFNFSVYIKAHFFLRMCRIAWNKHSEFIQNDCVGRLCTHR